jgi:hypothetical protein
MMYNGNPSPSLNIALVFDGLTLELAHYKVVIPSFLLVMLFLCALHSQYLVIFNNFGLVSSLLNLPASTSLLLM